MLNLSKNEKDQKILKNFQNILLNMNFHKIIEEEKEDLLVNLELEELKKIDPKKKWKIKFNNIKYKSIPLEFEDEQKYIKSFENLFLLELKANLLLLYNKVKGENFNLTCDSITKLKQYTYIKFKLPLKHQTLSINNLVFLTISQKKENYSLLGIVDDVKTSEVIIKVIVPFSKQDNFVGFFDKGKIWDCINLINLTTNEREWMSLLNIENVFLKKTILNPKLVKNEKVGYLKLNKTIYDKLNSQYNQYQLQAIKYCLKKEGVTLIQGPPGTGKTKTIVGILSGLYSSQAEKQKDFKMAEYKKQKILDNNEKMKKNWKPNIEKILSQNFENLLKKRTEIDFLETQTKFSFDVFKNESQKENFFLICGCSNISVDSIIIAIENQKLLNSQGDFFMPKIVRIGANYSKEVEKYSIDFLVDKYLKRNPNTKEALATIKNNILTEADIICTTLSFSGSNLLKSLKRNFETVIIDEACQSKEISCLIPIQYKTKRLILIGDPNQLKAISFSKLAEKLNFSRDLFSRLLKNKFPYFTLKIQYRMEPGISQLISSIFYQNKLIDHENLKNLKNKFIKLKKFSTFSFINTDGKEEIFNNSYKNEREAEVLIQVILEINKKYPKYNFFDIGIITPYSEQVNHIKRLLNVKNLDVEVNTVDSFQGREKEIIIFSGVRNNNKSSIGFMHEKNRINVSLSRAKSMLIMIGNENTLKISKYWKKIITHCKTQKKFINEYK